MNPNPSFRTIGVLVFLPVILLSCKKNGNASSASNIASGYLSSVRLSSVGTQVIDSFSYDADHHLLQFAQYDFDSTGGTPMVDSLVANFGYNGGSTTPGTCMIITQFSSDPHQLTYDGQGRIARDTSLSGSGYVAYYSYPGNNVSATVLFDGTAMNNQIDTQFLSGGNIAAFHIYYPNAAQTADSLSGAVQYTYAAYANPAYHSDLAGSLGPLLYNLSLDGYGGYEDFISKNVLNSIGGAANGLPPGYSLTLNANRDASGRVVLLYSSSLPVSAYNVRFYYY